MRQYLEAQGYPVTVAYSGEEALALFETIRPSIVLLDVMMPGRDGWEVCRLMKQHPSHGRGVRVIMVTALDQWDDKRQALQTGADDYVDEALDLAAARPDGRAQRGGAPGRGMRVPPSTCHDRVNEPVLLTDTDDATVRDAAELLDAWSVVVRRDRELAAAIEETPDVRVVVTTTENPTALRDDRRAGARALDAGDRRLSHRRRATSRHRAARGRVVPAYRRRRRRSRRAFDRRSRAWLQPRAALADRIERVEYEQMLYDYLTGLPDAAGDDRAVARDDQGARRADRALLQLRALLEDRGDLRLGEARRGARDDRAGRTRVSRRERAQVVARDGELHERRRLRLLPRACAGSRGDHGRRDHRARVEAAGASSAGASRRPTAKRSRRCSTSTSVARTCTTTRRSACSGSSTAAFAKRRTPRRASRSASERVASPTCKRSLRDRAVYIDFHPIVVTDTRQVYGYEALARGTLRTLRSPEVMFEVAAEADLIWELGRLCRSKAIEAMTLRLTHGELLFLNVDPHDFADPQFGQLDREVADPGRVVIEITERTAIKDYPKFRERLKALRERGYRFAVDDAGSGYAGLGSIANLEPDFIKLDISLINCIDTNFIKQNLVETMVRFANDQGAMVIAEGVERAEEYETVKGLGVHLVQGFFLHRPSENADRADDGRNASSRRSPETSRRTVQAGREQAQR